MFCSDDAVINENVTNEPENPVPNSTCSSEPLKIFVFPPKNKQFCFNESTSKIEVQPIDSPFENNEISRHETQNETTLTPLVEKFDILGSDVCCQSTPVKECEVSQNELYPKQILKVEESFKQSRLGKGCFLKGCKWSADGLCLLSNSEDNILRLFEFTDDSISNPRDDINPVLQMKEGGTVYDYVWYPHMNSSNPVSCVFACTSQGSPIHLWDAYTGQLRATYQPINQYDEVTTAYSLAFSIDGMKLYSGFKKCIRIFDISQPGRVSTERNLKVRGNSVFQCNIISSICINPVMPSLYALGCYDKTIGLYGEQDGDLICILKGHSGGITQLMFSKDGNYLFSGGRKDNEILCWDMRNPGKIVFSINRLVETHQKIQFDLSKDQAYLITGTTDGNIQIHNVNNTSASSEIPLAPTTSWKAHDDCVNGCQFHPTLPIFASTSGQRHLFEIFDGDDDDDDDDETRSEILFENSIKIWCFDQNS